MDKLKQAILTTVRKSGAHLGNITLKNFVENYILKHPQRDVLLASLSDIHILVALAKDELWKNLLNDKQYEVLHKQGSFILGYLLISDQKSENVHYIDFMDSFVEGYLMESYYITVLMMQKYTIKYMKNPITNIVVLKEIGQQHVGYMARYYDLDNSKDGDPITKLNTMIAKYKIDRNIIKWEALETHIVVHMHMMTYGHLGNLKIDQIKN